MNQSIRLTLLFLLSLISFNGYAEAFSCSGRIPNPVTDVDWQGVFPIKIGGVTVASFGQEDAGAEAPAVCACPIPTFPFVRIGMGVSWWEPARAAEVSTTPFCSPLLGGIPLAVTTAFGKRGSAKTNTNGEGNSFYHVHWYLFPLTNWMDMMTDTVCVSNESFDMMMLSELEPTWASDELSTIFSPEAVLFANPIAQVACAADCVAATVGFPLSELFWCAGCQGSIYPITGNVVNHESGIQASLLVIQRMHTKLHRILVSLDMNSKAAMCLSLPLPMINKRSYKTQMMYPIPTTFSAQPYGRSEALWAPLHEFPVKGEDFSYLIWRRRLCCAF